MLNAYLIGAWLTFTAHFLAAVRKRSNPRPAAIAAAAACSLAWPLFWPLLLSLAFVVIYCKRRGDQWAIDFYNEATEEN
jgi:hypothetical protein